MEIARREFQIPMVLEPEYLASPFLDELSGMTYLSYFMKEDSPGFHATLRWVNNQIPNTHVRNFTVSNMSVLRKIIIADIEHSWLKLSAIL
jgi:filamin